MWKDEMGIENGQKWSSNSKEGFKKKKKPTGFLCVSLAGIELAEQTGLELKRSICLCHLSARIKGVLTTTIRLSFFLNKGRPRTPLTVEEGLTLQECDGNKAKAFLG